MAHPDFLPLAYSYLSGLLFGAGVGGHALRLTLLSEGGFKKEDKGRIFVAISAMTIYGIATVLALYQNYGSLIIASVGPLLGVSAVYLFHKEIDRFQLVLGIFQAVAAVLSITMAAMLVWP